jgi:hypothetical protein
LRSKEGHYELHSDSVTLLGVGLAVTGLDKFLLERHNSG